MHIIYTGIFLGYFELYVFYHYFISLGTVETEECQELNDQVFHYILGGTLLASLATSMKMGGCMPFAMLGLTYIGYKIKQCTQNYQIMVILSGLVTSLFFAFMLPVYFKLHTQLMCADMTTKEMEVASSKSKFHPFLKSRLGIPYTQKLKNFINICILNKRRQKSELRKQFHAGIPLEYEAVDPDLLADGLKDQF